jgi:hypothetical protein
LPDSFLKRWLTALSAHHHHLANNLSIYTDPTNHLIGEATALWMLSVCLPELPHAKEQAKRSADILVAEVQRQVARDGVGREQASSYHRFVLDFYLQFLVLSRRSGASVPATVGQRVRAMLEFAATLAGMQGHAPMIGDSDDARGVPMMELVGWNFRDVLSTGGLLFENSQWLERAGGIAEASLWLLGPEAVQRFSQLRANPVSVPSEIYREGGYCFFRTGTAQGHAELIFDVGPLGLLPNAAHGHADALSIIVRINGHELLTDPGTGTYFSDPRVRDALRRTCAHNTVSVDRLDQADMFETFKWINPMRVTLLESSTRDDFDYAVAMHDGYHRLRKAVTHERAVLCIKSWGWIVVDRLAGSGEHVYTRHFTFPPTVGLRAEAAHSVVAVDAASGNGIALTFAEIDSRASTALRVDERGLWSPRYGEWKDTPRLAVETQGIGEAVLFTFIAPLFSGTSPAPTNSSTCTIQFFETERATLCSRRAADGQMDLVLVNPMGHVVLLADGTQSDARFLFVRRTSEGLVDMAFLAGEGNSAVGPGLALHSSTDERFASLSRLSRQHHTAAIEELS